MGDERGDEIGGSMRSAQSHVIRGARSDWPAEQGAWPARPKPSLMPVIDTSGVGICSV